MLRNSAFFRVLCVFRVLSSLPARHPSKCKGCTVLEMTDRLGLRADSRGQIREEGPMRKWISFVLFLVLICPLMTGAAEKKHLTIDDLLKVRRVSDPQLSPDGKWIAF